MALEGENEHLYGNSQDGSYVSLFIPLTIPVGHQYLKFTKVAQDSPEA